MIEVFKNLFVGSQFDEAMLRDRSDWFIISAARDPYHRQALGYTGRGAPKTIPCPTCLGKNPECPVCKGDGTVENPEYLIANRPGQMILNLVDVDDPAYIRDEIVTAALEKIDLELKSGHRVLVHCNQGGSRAPTLAMLYLRKHTDRLPQDDFDEAFAFFKGALYAAFAPAKGMLEYARAHWQNQTPAT